MTGTKSDMERWEYIDNRSDDEKKSTIWKQVTAEIKIEKRILKKWWEFWKS